MLKYDISEVINMNRRIIVGLITGVILGVFCIIGAQTRYTESVSTVYLFAFWLNRVFMGAFIAMLPVQKTLLKSLILGAVVGLLVSFTFYSATEFFDLIGFLVGAVYGVIIMLSLHKFAPVDNNA
jgi:uncharacterized membrane protein